MKKILGILCLVVTMVAYTACSSSASAVDPNSPEGVVTASLQAIQKGDVKSITSLMCFDNEMDEKNTEMIVDLFTAVLVEAAEQNGGIESFEIKRVEPIDDTHSVVTTQINFKNGEVEQEDKTAVILVGDKWMLDLTED